MAKNNNGRQENFEPTLFKAADNAMEAIEKENPSLKGILPKVFARPNPQAETKLAFSLEIRGKRM